MSALDFETILDAAGGDVGAACWVMQHQTWEDGDLRRLLTFYRVTVMGSVDRHRRAYEAGDPEALFVALAHCARFGAPIPEWATQAFCLGWGRYSDVAPDALDNPADSTLGGAFGIRRPKGFRPAAARRWKHWPSWVWSRVEALKREGVPVDESLFAQVAAEIHRDQLADFYETFYGTPLAAAERRPIGASTVRDMYYAFLRRIDSNNS